MQDEMAAAEQMIQRHGRDAAIRAGETAAALDAMGDSEGAARWRRVRSLILEKMRAPGSLFQS